jgi:2,3-dihydroxybenzoate-AMP ligase
MLEGCTPWPADLARAYRAQGYWQDITLWQMLERGISRWPHKTALVYGAQRLTYAELGARITQLAARFQDAGLKPLDRVVLQLPNSLEFIIVFFALTRCGAIPVLALPAHRREEIGHFIAHSAAAAYVTVDTARGFDFRFMAAEIASCSPCLRHVFVLGEPGPGQRSLSALLAAPDLPDADERLRSCAQAPEEVVMMLLSGGTTGIPKLIPRTHNDYVYNCRQSAAVAGFGEDTVFLAVLPLAHNYTLGCPGALGAFTWGGTVVVAPDTLAETAFPLIERERVTVVSAAVPVIVNWLNSDLAGQHDFGSLRVFMNGGAKLAPELRRRVERQFRCTYQESFGTGEGLLNMTRLDDPEDIRFTSSGRPVSPGDEIRIVDEHDRDLPDGTVGQLVCRGPYTIRGYYKAPEATRAAYTADGFYRMGDAVRRSGGYLYVEGRFKDLINRGGEKISCEEVENHILAHPAVKSVCVVAMPDPVFGEKACAFVIPRPGATLTLADLRAFLLEREIAKFKFPERLEIVEEFPVSPAGKILRRDLRRVIADKLTEEGTTAAAPAVDVPSSRELA